MQISHNLSDNLPCVGEGGSDISFSLYSSLCVLSIALDKAQEPSSFSCYDYLSLTNTWTFQPNLDRLATRQSGTVLPKAWYIHESLHNFDSELFITVHFVP